MKLILYGHMNYEYFYCKADQHFWLPRANSHNMFLIHKGDGMSIITQVVSVIGVLYTSDRGSHRIQG